TARRSMNSGSIGGDHPGEPRSLPASPALHARSPALRKDIMPRIAAVATSVPPYCLDQREVVRLAPELFGRDLSEIERLLPAFGNAGIDRRHSCVPIEWYLEPHGWAERNALFVEHALALIKEAAERCLERAGCTPEDV